MTWRKVAKVIRQRGKDFVIRAWLSGLAAIQIEKYIYDVFFASFAGGEGSNARTLASEDRTRMAARAKGTGVI